MVGKMISTLRSFAVQPRILSKECNIMAVGHVRSTAQDDSIIVGLVNPTYNCNCHPELDSGSINVDLNIEKRTLSRICNVRSRSRTTAPSHRERGE